VSARREVHVGPRLIGQAGAADVADDADDLAVTLAETHAAAHSAAFGEETPFDRFADDDDLRTTWPIA
jgi:hypothetical protein